MLSTTYKATVQQHCLYAEGLHPGAFHYVRWSFNLGVCYSEFSRVRFSVLFLLNVQ
jgi:hypothetical protein